MRAALDEAMLATDLADYLVRKGMPFREAHHKVGQVVRWAETKGIALSELSFEEYKRIAPEFDVDVKDIFDFGKSVAAREIIGGTGPKAVREQIAKAKKMML